MSLSDLGRGKECITRNSLGPYCSIYSLLKDFRRVKGQMFILCIVLGGR